MAGTLTLELQIPLQRNDASEHAIGARAGSVIGLGLETPKIERPEEAAAGTGRWWGARWRDGRRNGWSRRRRRWRARRNGRRDGRRHGAADAGVVRGVAAAAANGGNTRTQ